MPKELASLAQNIGSLQIHYILILFGFALAWKISDRKGKGADIDRETRRRTGRISLILIISGLALAALVTIPPLIANWGG